MRVAEIIGLAVDMSFIRRLAILILFCFLGNPISLGLLGIINRLTGCVRTVFLLYPANERYTRAYAFDWFAKMNFLIIERKV